MLLVPPAVFALVIASRRLPSPAIGLAGSVVLVTVKVAARANPDIARNKSGSAIAATLNRRFRSAIGPLPRHIQAALANFHQSQLTLALWLADSRRAAT